MPVTFPTPRPSLEAAEHPRDRALPAALRGPVHGDESSRAAEVPNATPAGPQPLEPPTDPTPGTHMPDKNTE